MKRIFHIVTHFDVGGAERVALNIAKSRNPEAEYHLVEVVRSRTPYAAEFCREMSEAGVAYHRFIMPEWHFHYLFERIAAFAFPLWFVWLFLRYRPQVIHCHTEIPELATCNFFQLFPFLRRRCAVVRTIHNTLLWQGMQLSERRTECFLARHGRNIAISLSVQQAFAARNGEEPPVIYNGVEPTRQLPYPGIVAGKTNIMFAGRLEKQKGIATLAEIIRRAEPLDRYFFHIFGKGSLLPMLREELSGCRNVAVSGPLHGLPHYYGSFSHVIMPSVHEGFGLIAVEAALAGVPPIINDCPGLNETMPSGWPLMAHGNSLDDYSAILSTVIPQADSRALADTARAFAEEHFSMARMQEEYEKVYFAATPSAK